MLHTVTAPPPRACEENIDMATKTKPQDSLLQQDVNSNPRKFTKVQGQGHASAKTHSIRCLSECLLQETLHLRPKTVKEACDIILGLFEMKNSKMFCYCEIQY